MSQNINNNAAILDMPAVAMENKAKKKEQEALAKQQLFIQQMQEELALAVSGDDVSETPPTPPTPPAAPPATQATSQKLNDNETAAGKSLCDALAEAAFYLSEMEASIVGKYNLSATQAQAKIMQAQQTFSAQMLQKAIQQADQITQEQEAQKHRSFWEKLCSVIVTAVTSAIAILAGQPEIAMLMIGMEVMNSTGTTSKLVGNSFLATLGVIAVTAILSGGAGALSGSARLGVALAIQNVIQVVTSTQGLANILKEIPMSEQEREKVTLGVTIGLMVLAVLSTIVAGGALTKTMDAAEGGASFLSKMRAAIKTAVSSLELNSPRVMQFLEIVQKDTNAVSSALQIVEGKVNIDLAGQTEAMTGFYSMVDLIRSLMDAMAQTISERQSVVSSQTQQSSADQQTIFSWLSGERAFARALA
jgi:hypothetical protein